MSTIKIVAGTAYLSLALACFLPATPIAEEQESHKDHVTKLEISNMQVTDDNATCHDLYSEEFQLAEVDSKSVNDNLIDSTDTCDLENGLLMICK